MTTMVAEKTLEQLEEESRQAAEALAHAKEAARQAEREAKRKADADARIAKEQQEDVQRVEILKALQIALSAEGIATTLEEGREEFRYAGCREWRFSQLRGVDIHIERESNRSWWTPGETDRHLLIVTENADHKRVRFPKRKDGTYNYAKIAHAEAEKIRICQKRKEQQEEAKSTRAQSGVLARQLQTKYGLSEYTLTVVSTSSSPNKVTVRINTTLSVETADKLLAFAKELGIKLD